MENYIYKNGEEPGYLKETYGIDVQEEGSLKAGKYYGMICILKIQKVVLGFKWLIYWHLVVGEHCGMVLMITLGYRASLALSWSQTERVKNQ